MQLIASSSVGKKRLPIGMTPLIDVVFILLLFFMLASSYQKYQGINLNTLPQDDHAIPQTEKEPVLIELAVDDKFIIDQRVLSRTQLLDELKILTSNMPQPTILVLPQPQIDLQNIISFMGLLKSKGVQQLNLLPAQL